MHADSPNQMAESANGSQEASKRATLNLPNDTAAQHPRRRTRQDANSASTRPQTHERMADSQAKATVQSASSKQTANRAEEARSRKAERAAGGRPHASDRPTGVRALVPKSLAGRIVAVVIILLIAKIAIFDLRVAHESIVDNNYYADPMREYAADIVDTLADRAVQVTPDSANSAINSLRERLTGRSKWANTVIDAEQYFGLDTSATYLILAIIQVESGGDETVDAIGNIMQIEPVTDAYTYIAQGVPEMGVVACTPQASIYAGTKVVQDALGCFAENYGYEADLSNHPQAALVAQGYNYGYAGWISYCAQAGLTEWSAWAASNYQDTVMQGGGSCIYGQRVEEELTTLDPQ